MHQINQRSSSDHIYDSHPHLDVSKWLTNTLFSKTSQVANWIYLEDFIFGESCGDLVSIKFNDFISKTFYFNTTLV